VRRKVGLIMAGVGVAFFIGGIMFYGGLPIREVPLLGQSSIYGGFILIAVGIGLVAVARDP
jgi:hypothetical protein